MRFKFAAIRNPYLPPASFLRRLPARLRYRSSDNRTLTVSASDHAEADADVADLNVGFVAYGQTLQAVTRARRIRLNAIVKAMVDAGATRAEMQSRSQRVSRLSDAETKTRRGSNSVVQSWTVSVDPKTAALVLDAAVQALREPEWRYRLADEDSVALDAEAGAPPGNRACLRSAQQWRKAWGLRLASRCTRRIV